MAFSPHKNIVGSLFKKTLTKSGREGVSQAPRTPLATPLSTTASSSVNSRQILRVLNFAKSQAPHFASIKFRDCERKLELECINFRDLFLHSLIKMRP